MPKCMQLMFDDGGVTRDEPRRLSQQACGVSLLVVWDLSDSKVVLGEWSPA